MRAPLNATDDLPYRRRDLDAPTSRALAGAGVVATILALLPGIGLYLAVVILPATYLIGVPVAVGAFARFPTRSRRARRVVGAGAAAGGFVGLVPFLGAVFDGGSPVFTLYYSGLGAVFGSVVALIGHQSAERLPAKAVASFRWWGPLAFASSLLLQSGAMLAR